jgi:hypothetical protein
VSGAGKVALSSALAPSALICLLPGHQPNQPVALPLPSPAEPSHCPCCWRVDALQQAAARGADGGGAVLASSPQAAAAESKALRKAARLPHLAKVRVSATGLSQNENKWVCTCFLTK